MASSVSLIRVIAERLEHYKAANIVVDPIMVATSGAKWFRGKRIDNPNTHGTGCTLSSAIAANLAKGESLEKAV